MYDKKADPVLTDYDITINSIHRENMFKGTIIVCIVYAIFAFVLITAAYFSDNIRDLLFDKFLPFTLIYIIGTIIIILIFIYYIVSFVPKKIDKNKLDDSISCPDYWKLEILDDDVIENSFDTTNYNKKLFKYRCVMDEKVFNKGAIYKQDRNTDPELQYKLGNKPSFISKLTDDILPTTSDTLNTLNTFLEYNKENDKFYYLYKNVNDYNDKNLTYTNNRAVSKKIKKDLQDAALIMNNYQKKKNNENVYYEDKIITVETPVATPSASATAAISRTQLVTNYLNSPNLLTSASSLSPGSTNIAIADDAVSYYSTVYDWSTFNLNDYKNKIGDNWNKKVYIIDTNVQSGTNFIQIGTMKQNQDNKNIYFEGINSITIGTGLFTNNKNNKNYYFDKTYISSSDLSETVTKEGANGLIKGPKVRLFHVSERPVQIPSTSSVIDSAKIPLMCSAVYPSFLASKEDEYSENNTLRCAYSSICKIPWSDLHCNEITIKDSAAN
jgi:hypothetical protein